MDKKRSGPDPVDPVQHGGVRYEAVQWGKARGLPQNGGYVGAFDAQTGAELWLLKVYDVHYDADMEDDKQDVFVTRLAFEGPGRLSVENERGERFAVDTGRRCVLP